jgi:hypothetical protein
MRKVAALEAERRHLMEMQLRASGFVGEEYEAFEPAWAAE